MTQNKINSKSYWDERFGTADWEDVGGRDQTREFARAQIPLLQLPSDFSGRLLDFGCGLGDAFPEYRRVWPESQLIGVDFSEAAIRKCDEKYGDIAEFRCASHRDCPEAEVIIVSNVLEHIENDIEVVQSLLRRCSILYIVVPYKEQYLIEEHLRSYGKGYFDRFQPERVQVFASKGWSQYGLRALWFEIRIKNILRPTFGKRLLRRRLQIMYELHGKTP